MAENEVGAAAVNDLDAAAESSTGVKDAVKEKVETARQRVRAVGEDLKSQASKASVVAKERYGSAKENVRHGYERARKDVDQLVEDVNVYVRDNPGRSVLIAAGIGFAIGYLLRGDRNQ